MLPRLFFYYVCVVCLVCVWKGVLFRSVNACKCVGGPAKAGCLSAALQLTALRQGLMVNGKLIVSARLAGQRSQDVFVSALKCWGHRAWAAMTAFYVDAGDSSSGPLACIASVLTCQATQLSYCYQEHQEPQGVTVLCHLSLSKHTWDENACTTVSLLEVTQLYMEINNNKNT